MLFRNLERTDIRFGFNHIRISAPKFQFSLRVSKRSTNWQTSGEYTYWAHYKFLIFPPLLLIFVLLQILLPLILVVLPLRLNLCSCRLIDLTSSLDDAPILVNIWRFVVARKSDHLLASVWAQHRSTVAHIRRVAHIVNDKNHDGARARPLHNSNLSCLFVLYLTLFKERFFGFRKSFPYRHFWLPRKRFLSYDKMVQIVA